MACTTILVGKKASYDGSCMIGRNDDAPAGKYAPKKYVVVHPDKQPRAYESVISHVKIDLPDNPMRYTAVPNALKDRGIWAASGVNEANVGMSATETITSNARVLGADPLVENGIGEEDIVVLVLPYIHSAKEGVKRLGHLLETYGTYEMNGIAFVDVDEIWWLETIGGHHWMARKVPDDVYVVMPNQLGMDHFDFDDTENYMCSSDLKEFIAKYHLDITDNPRDMFGSHDDSDHIYNTPRAWDILRNFNPHTKLDPLQDDLPWCMVPEKKLTVEDVKYGLSLHFQNTPYDPYGKDERAGMYRCIGVNRTNFLTITQMKKDEETLEWVSFGSNVFNVSVPMYSDVDTTPDYFNNTTKDVSTENFYWASRLLGAMADASYKPSVFEIERYQNKVGAKAHELVNLYNEKIKEEADADKKLALRKEANEQMAAFVRQETNETLNKVLYHLSNQMQNAFSRSDA